MHLSVVLVAAATELQTEKKMQTGLWMALVRVSVSPIH